MYMSRIKSFFGYIECGGDKSEAIETGSIKYGTALYLYRGFLVWL